MSGTDDIPIRADGLQLDEERGFQIRFWAVERIAWVAFGLVLVVALAGLTGGGGLLSGGSRDLGAARVDYPRVARWATPDLMSVSFAQAGTRSLLLSPEFLRAFEIETIQPQPTHAATSAQGLRLEFAVESDGAAPVRLGLQANAAGRFTYRIGIDAGEPATFATYILP